MHEAALIHIEDPQPNHDEESYQLINQSINQSINKPLGSTDLDCLLDVPLLILGIHGHELEDHQVERGRDDGQAEHDEEERERDVLGLVLERVVLLQRHEVAEADGCERHEAVVDGVEVGPA